jgi:hypothetical protein
LVLGSDSFDMTKACPCTITSVKTVTEEESEVADGLAFDIVCPFHGTHTFFMTDVANVVRLIVELSVFGSLLWGEEKFEALAFEATDKLMDTLGLPQAGSSQGGS